MHFVWGKKYVTNLKFVTKTFWIKKLKFNLKIQDANYFFNQLVLVKILKSALTSVVINYFRE